MKDNEINDLRLINQRLLQSEIKKPGDLLSLFGCIQGQDYMSALWAMGIRIPDSKSSEIENAILKKKIVRSWILRGTLQFTAAQDLRWMIKLISLKIMSSSKSRYRQLELDEKTLTKSLSIISKILDGGKQYTREEISRALLQKGIEAKGIRLVHILHRASMDLLICQGPKKGVESTFTLIDEWLPPSKVLSKDEALGELAVKYFSAHGPASLEDFIWWSGLNKTEARNGIEISKRKLEAIKIGAKSYWLSAKNMKKNPDEESTLLLPAYDEYHLGYRDRSACLDPEFSKQVLSVNGIFYPVIVINGKIEGLWKRSIQKDKINIEMKPFSKLSKLQKDKIKIAESNFRSFFME